VWEGGRGKTTVEGVLQILFTAIAGKTRLSEEGNGGRGTSSSEVRIRYKRKNVEVKQGFSCNGSESGKRYKNNTGEERREEGKTWVKRKKRGGTRESGLVAVNIWIRRIVETEEEA